MPEAAAVSVGPRTVGSIVVPGTAMIAVTFGLSRYGYGLLLPDIRAELGVSAGAAGVISSAAYVAYVVGNLGVVPLMARRGPRMSLAIAAMSAAVGMALIAGARGPLSLAVGVIVAGSAAGLAFPPYAGIVAAAVPSERRDRVWSTISSGTGWGVAVAGPIAIVAGGHWRLCWLAFVVAAVAVGAFAVRLAPVGATDPSRSVSVGRSWFRRDTSGALVGSAILVGVGSSVWWAFSVDALRAGSVDVPGARAIYALTGAASLLGSFAGRLLGHLGLRRGYLVAVGLLSSSLAAFALVIDQVVGAAIASAGFGAAYASVVAGQGVWSARVFPDHPTAGLAIANTALALGTVTGPALAGYAIEHVGFRPSLLGAATCLAFAVLFNPTGRP